MSDPIQQLPEATKSALDGIFGGITISAVLGWLPQATAILSFLWVCIRLYETQTVQRWLGRGK